MGRTVRIALLAMLIFGLLNFSELAFWTGRIAVPAYWTYQTRDLQGGEFGKSLRYHPSMKDHADQVWQAKLKYSGMMEEYFGFSPDSPLILLLEPGELNMYLGEGYSLKSAGAYHSGVVLLGVGDTVRMESVVSTLVHEMGHHYVHVMARGNYPIWYTEGLAQLMESKFLDRLWFDGTINKDYYKYSIEEMSEGFYALEDQVSAYRQAFDLVMAIEHLGDGQANQQILHDLGRGVTFNKALMTHTGLELDGLYNHVFGVKR